MKFWPDTNKTVTPNRYPDDGEGIYDASPKLGWIVFIAVTLALLWVLCGCSSAPKDPWQKWQSENPVKEYHFDSGTGKWQEVR